MNEDLVASYQPHEGMEEPFGTHGILIMQSGIPVRVRDGGGQGTWVRVPAPQAGEEDEVLTVQPDLSVAWSPSSGGGQLSASLSLSNADLRTTNNFTVVPAAGTDTVIMPTTIIILLNYGGTNVWSNSPSVQLRYNGVSGTASALTTPQWGQASTRLSSQAAPFLTASRTQRNNEPLTFNLGVAATGNAANDNTAEVTVYYFVHNL